MGDSKDADEEEVWGLGEAMDNLSVIIAEGRSTTLVTVLTR